MIYHYVLTLGRNNLVYTVKGEFAPQPGQTRKDAFESCLKAAQDHLRMQGAPVIFWSLEPMELQQ